jgi:nicotinamidase/pyrazinamidase
MKALLIIDLQNDFLPGGALAVPRGNELIAIANRLMPHYDLVVATQDWHTIDHISFANQHPGKHVGDVVNVSGIKQNLWPVHCVQNSYGAQLAHGLNRAGIDHVVQKGTDRFVDSYSAFFDNARLKLTGLDDFLHAYGVTEVHLMGVATDYCVKATALDAVERGFHTVLLADAVRGVDLHPGNCQRAIDEMCAAGVELEFTRHFLQPITNLIK